MYLLCIIYQAIFYWVSLSVYLLVGVFFTGVFTVFHF